MKNQPKYDEAGDFSGNRFCLDGKAPARIQHFLPTNMYYLCESGMGIEGIYLGVSRI
jgi:hypothetical protein